MCLGVRRQCSCVVGYMVISLPTAGGLIWFWWPQCEGVVSHTEDEEALAFLESVESMQFTACNGKMACVDVAFVPAEQLGEICPLAVSLLGTKCKDCSLWNNCLVGFGRNFIGVFSWTIFDSLWFCPSRQLMYHMVLVVFSWLKLGTACAGQVADMVSGTVVYDWYRICG